MIKYIGRTGNNLIQYFSAYFFCKKFNIPFNVPQECPEYWLDVNSKMINWGDLFGVNPNDFIVHEGGNIGRRINLINDYNFIDFYYQNNFGITNVSKFEGYFQNKEFLASKQNEIKKLLNINYDDTINENDVLIHYRLGDLQSEFLDLPLSYYDNLLSEIKFNKGYIISDTLNHNNCQYLIEKYNLIPFDNENPINVIIFAKNFNNLILSDGTFSWWIGFLSNAKNIFHGKSDKIWTINNIFLDEWKQINI
ncbi:hypothetical protein UFOVP117_365 [uncultured Caudovirales phage]|uniref:Glycosyl transferase family 11 n=1 Tax=uncultured Caudovirales phage TaxID=2100421 RepID=A0A6J5LBP8_9CAUD|nr:hypothetical protein UFOVP117_365 [uncultured Caudovirales phage]